jgi:hypothetical protein
MMSASIATDTWSNAAASTAPKHSSLERLKQVFAEFADALPALVSALGASTDIHVSPIEEVTGCGRKPADAIALGTCPIVRDNVLRVLGRRIPRQLPSAARRAMRFAASPAFSNRRRALKAVVGGRASPDITEKIGAGRCLLA